MRVFHHYDMKEDYKITKSINSIRNFTSGSRGYGQLFQTTLCSYRMFRPVVPKDRLFLPVVPIKSAGCSKNNRLFLQVVPKNYNVILEQHVVFFGTTGRNKAACCSDRLFHKNDMLFQKKLLFFNGTTGRIFGTTSRNNRSFCLGWLFRPVVPTGCSEKQEIF